MDTGGISAEIPLLPVPPLLLLLLLLPLVSPFGGRRQPVPVQHSCVLREQRAGPERNFTHGAMKTTGGVVVVSATNEKSRLRVY
jgi:hypothetical protein